MKLLTKEILEKLPALYSQEHSKDPTAQVKFFNPTGAGKWYATEGSWIDEDGYYDTDKPKVDFLFFGAVEITDYELGYFSLSELESYRGPFGLGIERDMYWKPRPLSQCKGN